MGSPETISGEILKITPEFAETLLNGSNVDNRKLRPAIVNRYARDMELGNWKVTGEAIKITADGLVTDGQHRLTACVQSGKSFITLVVRGVEFEARDVMDTGARRTFADVLRWHGEHSVAGLASAIESAMLWEEGGTPSHKGATHTNMERLAWLEEHPEIREAVSAWSPLVGAPFRFPVSSGAPFLLRARKISTAQADQFVHLLKTGEMLGTNHPIAKLRSWLFNSATKHTRCPREEYAAIAIKAWNAFIAEREIRALAWRRVGTTAEPFPLMLGPDGRTYEEIALDPTYNADFPLGTPLSSFTTSVPVEESRTA